MYEIVEKEPLNGSVTKMVIKAPFVSRKAQAGQFIILRVDEDGERIPLTIADFDRINETVTVIFQIAGAETARLNEKKKGEFICDFAGPLGNPTKTECYKKVAVIGGGVGCAIALPITKKFYEGGAEVHSIIGFRTKNLIILEKDFQNVSHKSLLVTDDGTAGEKGFVTDALEGLIKSGEKYELVFAVGPLPMMKAVCELTKKYNIKTVVSMNPIMVDGTGMCGGCRLTVGGKTKFACVDGPEFDGHLVDFDEAIQRGGAYRKFEREADCRLLKTEVK